MAQTTQGGGRTRRFPKSAIRKGVLAGGTVTSLVLCLVTPVFCLLTSPVLITALQNASVQTAMADDPGATLTAPTEEDEGSVPEEDAVVAPEDEENRTSGVTPEEQGTEEQGAAVAAPAIGEPPAETAAAEESGSFEDNPDLGEAAESAEDPQEGVDPNAYLNGPTPREEDLPMGPDMSGAVESGMPMEGGVSAEPAEALMQTIEEQAFYGNEAVALQIDGLTGIVEYL